MGGPLFIPYTEGEREGSLEITPGDNKIRIGTPLEHLLAPI